VLFRSQDYQIRPGLLGVVCDASPPQTSDMASSGGRYVYETPWTAYAMALANRQDRFRLAIGSFREGEPNHIQVVELNQETKKLRVEAETEHPFQATKLMWKPSASTLNSGGNSDKVLDGHLFASSSTHLDLWRYSEGQIKSVGRLPTARSTKSDGSPPLTSFDWSPINENKIAGSSLDTTCSIWDIEKHKIESQLIAHDKAVYDVCFGQRDSIAHLFSSVGADGSVRVFDQRNLEHSTIIYETNPPRPLLRLSWNPNDKNLIACIAMDQPVVLIIDIRRPSVSWKELNTGNSCPNSIMWSPCSKNHLLCGTQGNSALIWDVRDGPPSAQFNPKAAAEAAADPKAMCVHAYDTGSEVLQVQWFSSQPDHVALGTARQAEILKL